MYLTSCLKPHFFVHNLSLSRIPVAWHLNRSSALPWHRVTSDGSLVLLHADHSAQGHYSCYDSRNTLLRSVTLRLGCKCSRTPTLTFCTLVFAPFPHSSRHSLDNSTWKTVLNFLLKNSFHSLEFCSLNVSFAGPAVQCDSDNMNSATGLQRKRLLSGRDIDKALHFLQMS